MQCSILIMVAAVRVNTLVKIELHIEIVCILLFGNYNSTEPVRKKKRLYYML